MRKKYSGSFAAFLSALAVVFLMASCDSNNSGGGSPPPSTPDFTFTATGPSGSVVSGASATVQLNSAALNGFTGSIQVSYTLPSGFQTDTPSPVALAVGVAKSIKLTVPEVTANASYNIMFTATSGTLTPKTATVNLAVTAPADFTFGVTGNANVAVGAPTILTLASSSSISITVTLPQTPGFMLSPPGPWVFTGTQTVQIAIDNTVLYGQYTLAFSATDGTHTHPASVLMQVWGNGGLNPLTYDASIPPAEQDILSTLLTGVYSGCGTALLNYPVTIQKGNGVSAFSGSANVFPVPGPVSGTIYLGELAATDPAGEAVPDNFSAVHEEANADIFPAVAVEQTYGPAFQEGFSTACNIMEDPQLAAAGIPAPTDDYTQLVESDQFLLNWDGTSVASSRRAPYAVGGLGFVLYAANKAPEGTSVADWASFGLKDFGIDLAAAIAKNGGQPLDANGVLQVLSGSAGIDGDSSAFFNKLPGFLKTTTVSNPLLFHLVVHQPQAGSIAAYVEAEAFQLAEGVPITLRIYDATGTDVTPPSSSWPGIVENSSWALNVSITMPSWLPQGAYKVIGTAEVNSMVYTSFPSYFAVVPAGKEGPVLNPNQPYPGLYFVTVDSNGNPTWIAIVACAPSGQVPAACTVNGQTYSQPGLASRFIVIPSNGTNFAVTKGTLVWSKGG